MVQYLKGGVEAPANSDVPPAFTCWVKRVFRAACDSVALLWTARPVYRHVHCDWLASPRNNVRWRCPLQTRLAHHKPLTARQKMKKKKRKKKKKAAQKSTAWETPTALSLHSNCHWRHSSSTSICMSQHIRGVYDYALYKSKFYLLKYLLTYLLIPYVML